MKATLRKIDQYVSLSKIMPSSMLGLTDSLIENCEQRNFASMVSVLQIVGHNAINVETSP